MAKRKKHTYGSIAKDREMMAFDLYENLKRILKDLHAIDSLIPRETSRHAGQDIETNKFLLIQRRKDDLLRYIQGICRDHMWWSADLINRGWTPEQKQKARKLPKGDLRDWLKEQCSS